MTFEVHEIVGERLVDVLESDQFKDVWDYAMKSPHPVVVQDAVGSFVIWKGSTYKYSRMTAEQAMVLFCDQVLQQEKGV